MTPIKLPFTEKTKKNVNGSKKGIMVNFKNESIFKMPSKLGTTLSKQIV